MKLVKRTSLIILVLIVAYAVSYAWRAFPIISGYGSKMLCSCTFVAGRDPENVIANEIGRFPLSLGSFKADRNDSSVTGSVWGMAVKKAIYRKGLGCTLVNGMTENEFRAQHFNVPARPAINTDTIPWPSGDLVKDTIIAGVNYEKINAVLADAFAEPGPDRLRRTRAMIVLYDGNIIAEKYAEGFNKNTPLIGWSMTKSITNALVGILVKQGKLDVNKPAAIDFWQNDERSHITLGNLMHASSGLKWEENYAGPSNATNMLFKEKDMGLFAAHRPAKVEPETVFQYSSGTTNIISYLIRQAVGENDYHSFAASELLYKLGMYSMVIEPDAGGTFVGSSYSFATARDWARFGLLYYHNGNWQGEQILPDGWVKYSTTPAPAAPRGEYGAQFWLNAGAPGNAANRYYPDAPTDLYWADGYEGQNVFIIPSKKLVIVKLSLSQGDHLDDNKFLADVISALP